MYPKGGKEENQPHNQMYMEQYDYGWGNQMYGGAFNNQEYPQSQQYYNKGFTKKEQMNPMHPGSGMYYPQPEGNEWNFEDGHQMNSQPGYSGQRFYQEEKSSGMHPMPEPANTFNIQAQKRNTFSGFPSKPAFKPPPPAVEGVERLYSEPNDGEITIEIEPSSGLRKLVTAIDISSLYKEKRNNAIQLSKRFETLYHEYLISPLCPVIMDGNRLYFQTEAPENGSS